MTRCSRNVLRSMPLGWSLLLLCLGLATPCATHASVTPQNRLLVDIEPAYWDIGVYDQSSGDQHPMGRFATEEMLTAGYSCIVYIEQFAPTAYSPNRVCSVTNFAQLTDGAGWLVFATHGAGGPNVRINNGVVAGLALESYAPTPEGRAARDARYTYLLSNGYSTDELFVGDFASELQNTQTTGYGIYGTSAYFNRAELGGHQGKVVDVRACDGADLTTAFAGCAAYVGYDGIVYTPSQNADVAVMYGTNLSGRAGLPKVEVGDALNGGQKLRAGQTGDVVTNPRVLARTLPSERHITVIETYTITFDCVMDTSVPAASVVKGALAVGVGSQTWVNGGTGISFTVRGRYIGAGFVYVASTIAPPVGPPSYVGAQSLRGIALDGNRYAMQEPIDPDNVNIVERSAFPAVDDYVIRVWSDVGGDNPEAGVEHFTVQRTAGGLRADWATSYESEASKFLVEGRFAADGAFEVLGSAEAVGPSAYSLSLPAPERVEYRLREVEVSGDTLTYNYVSARDSVETLAEGETFGAENYADSLRAVLAAAYPYNPGSVPENTVYFIFAPDAWIQDAQNLAGFWSTRGLKSEAVSLASIGGAPGWS